MPRSEYLTYRVLEHSGDLRLEAWGEDLLEAIAHASSGLVDQIVPLEAIAEREERDIRVEGDDETARIVAFLNELVYLVFAGHWLPRRIRTLQQCSRHGCRALEAVLTGEPVDPARHAFVYDVKAVTYHGFEIAQDGERTVIRFVCDL